MLKRSSYYITSFRTSLKGLLHLWVNKCNFAYHCQRFGDIIVISSNRQLIPEGIKEVLKDITRYNKGRHR